MDDAKIIKALRVCGNGYGRCDGCPHIDAPAHACEVTWRTAADRLEALTAKSCPTCARSRECAAKPHWDGAAVINCPMWAGQSKRGG